MGKKHFRGLRPGQWHLITYVFVCTWASYSICKLFKAWYDQAAPEFGFILTRCVRNSVHDKYWQESHRCIRRLFPDSPIVIIDDHSVKALLSDSYQVDENTHVVASPFPPGRGESLPYHYFLMERPFRKAIIMQDGMFLHRRTELAKAIADTVDYRFLWHFDEFLLNDFAEQDKILSSMHRDQVPALRALRSNASAWAGCFGGSAIIAWDFLAVLQQRYGLLDALPAITNRGDRMGFERVLALCCIDGGGQTGSVRQGEGRSVFGNILRHRRAFEYSYSDYLADNASGSLEGEPCLKIWSGR